jgi:hypothetical protein
MPRVGFEATIPAFERAKTGHALDRAATVISKHRDFTFIYKEDTLCNETRVTVRLCIWV